MSILGSDHIDLDPHRDPTAAELDAYDRRTPVDMRLAGALAKIPYAIQRQGVPLAVIQAQLRGRTRRSQTCHPGELGAALARRGWTRRRLWERRDSEGALTLWYPPGVDPVQASIAARLKLPRGRPPKWLQRARQLAKESGIVF